ncbi:hypothetical protein [Priestia aryabhattai]|uniref:hypothetical protein n=1 Tax=Priestia aryabhattai TaxID=412384 RepID=UPI003C8F928D
MTLVYLLILAVVYIFLDLAMRKKLNTKMKKSYWRSFKGRRPLFITLEMVMLAAFLVLIFVIPPAYTSVFPAGVFVLPSNQPLEAPTYMKQTYMHHTHKKIRTNWILHQESSSFEFFFN